MYATLLTLLFALRMEYTLNIVTKKYKLFVRVENYCAIIYVNRNW